MVPLTITISEKAGPRAVLNKFRREAQKEAYRFVADWWWRHVAPGHFKEAASQKYGYMPRSFKHNRRKRRLFGHQRPLEFSGTMKRQVLGQGRIDATRRGATLRMYGPRYLYQYRKSFMQPHKAEELTAVTAGEEQAMGALLERRLTRAMNTVTEESARRIA